MNACRREIVPGVWQDATHAICGGYVDGGGGVLAWAYSYEEARTLMQGMLATGKYKGLNIRVEHPKCPFCGEVLTHLTPGEGGWTSTSRATPHDCPKWDHHQADPDYWAWMKS